MHTDIVAPDIEIRITVPEKIAAFERLRREAAWQVEIAETAEDRLEAQLWQDNAERNLTHWKAQLAARLGRA